MLKDSHSDSVCEGCSLRLQLSSSVGVPAPSWSAAPEYRLGTCSAYVSPEVSPQPPPLAASDSPMMPFSSIRLAKPGRSSSSSEGDDVTEQVGEERLGAGVQETPPALVAFGVSIHLSADVLPLLGLGSGPSERLSRGQELCACSLVCQGLW